MPDDQEGRPQPAYAAHHWGALADDPFREIIPETPTWRRAVKRAWLRSGGTEEEFEQLFGEEVRAKLAAARRRKA